MHYANVEPTDVVNIDGNVIRVTARRQRGSVIEFDGAFDNGAVYIGTAIAGTAQSVTQVIPFLGNTSIFMMDLPLLRDADNDAGFYISASGFSGAWPGTILFKSEDGGASYAESLVISNAATSGGAVTALSDFSDNTFDEFNTVTVYLTDGTLSSTTELAVLNGANPAVLGNEIIQYKTATLNADGSYTLSGLLRGRKGTVTSSHVIGERFVAVSLNTTVRSPDATADIGLLRLYKPVTIGTTLEQTSAIEFTNTAQGLECLSPVLLGSGRDASGNITVTWVRRTRIGGEWRDNSDTTLGETVESYELDVYTDSSYNAIVRTLSSGTPTATYSAAQQTTDFGSTQTIVYVKVYQLSATVGRGFALTGVI